MSVEGKCCRRASPTAGTLPISQEPHGAPARADKCSRVLSLQLLADLQQHGVIFTHMACSMNLAELSGGAMTCHGVGHCPLPSFLPGGGQGATLNFSSSGLRSVSLMPLCPLQSARSLRILSVQDSFHHVFSML